MKEIGIFYAVRPELVEGCVAHHQRFDRLSANGIELSANGAERNTSGVTLITNGY